VDGLQKEVAAIEPKPQAQTLDLLERILPARARTASSGLLGEIALNLGDLRAKVEPPDFADVLGALGIAMPAGFDPQSPDQFKTAVASAAFDLAIAAPVRSFYSKVVRALSDEPAASSAPRLRLSAVPYGFALDTDPVGPPVWHGELPPPAPVGPPDLPRADLVPDPERIGPPARQEIFEKLASSHTGRPLETVPLGRPLDTGLTTDPIGPPVRMDAPSPIGPPSRVEGLDATSPSGPPVFVGELGGARVIGPPRREGASLDTSLIGPPSSVSKSVTGTPSLRLAAIQAFPGQPHKLVEGLSATQVAVTPIVGFAARPVSHGSLAALAEPLSKKPEAPSENELPENAPLAAPIDSETEEAIEPDDDALANADTDTVGNERLAPLEPSKLDRSTAPRDADRPLDRDALAQVRERVIEQIEEMVATRGNGRVTVRLSPEDLGSLTIAVSSLGESVETKITASNEQVRHALHTHRADLIQTIESRGLTMNSFTVGHEANADHQGQPRQGQDARQDFARAHNLAQHARHEETARPTFTRFARAGVDTLA
jgi:hypothetical protein